MLSRSEDPGHLRCSLGALERKGNAWFLHCKASGKGPLSSSTCPEEMIGKWCGSCPIPSELKADKKPCLYLIPVRFRRDVSPLHTFSCRWFYRLMGRKVVTEIWKLCGGCPHWFPRPPDENLIPRQEEWSERVVRQFSRDGDVSESPAVEKADPGMGKSNRLAVVAGLIRKLSKKSAGG